LLLRRPAPTDRAIGGAAAAFFLGRAATRGFIFRHNFQKTIQAKSSKLYCTGQQFVAKTGSIVAGFEIALYIISHRPLNKNILRKIGSVFDLGFI